MPMTFSQEEARLEGACAAEDAEQLVEWLQSHQEGRLDLEDCTHLHAAVFQAVLVAKGPVIPPRDDFLRRCLVAAGRIGDRQSDHV